MFPTDYSIPPQDLAVEAEARGYESLWLPEHSHIPTSRKSPWPGGAELPKYYYDTYDPFLSLAAAAAVTKTIKLGTGICLVVERDPIHTAKEVSTVDQLSSGRFIFGIGAGWNEEEMANHGTAFATRFKLMRERIEAMKQIWTQSTAEFGGEFVKFEPMLDAGRHRFDAGRFRAADHLIGKRGGRNIDIAGRDLQKRVAHGTADHACLLAIAIEQGEYARGGARIEPGRVFKPVQRAHFGAPGCSVPGRSVPGTNLPFSICAGI